MAHYILFWTFQLLTHLSQDVYTIARIAYDVCVCLFY